MRCGGVKRYIVFLSLLIGVTMEGNNYTQAIANTTLTQPLVPNSVKGMFASMETSRDISGDWLQLEKDTFNDLKKRGKVSKDIKFEDLSNPNTYEQVARTYILDLASTHKIPTAREAALWSWRPGWYQKYHGNINEIPAAKEGVAGKKARTVMQERLNNLTQAGY